MAKPESAWVPPGPLPMRNSALAAIAQLVGEPGLDEDENRLVHVLAEQFDNLRASRMPDNPHLRELLSQAAGLGNEEIDAVAQLCERLAQGERLIVVCSGCGLLRCNPRQPCDTGDADTQPEPERQRLARELDATERAYLLECGWSIVAGAEGPRWIYDGSRVTYTTAGARAEQERRERGSRL